jgi:predicted membrane protein
MNVRDRSQHRVVFGVLIILVGALALLDNLHVFDARQVIHFWPMVFVVFGVLKVSQSRDVAGCVVGGALIAAGTAMTLQNMGIIAFRWRDWWPLLLITGGVLIILTGLFGRQAAKSVGTIEMRSTNDSIVDVGVLMSGINMSNATQDFRGGKVSAVVGGVEIDLRNASMQESATLSIFAMMGGIVIKVPADWSVVSNCVPIMGGVDDKSVPPARPVKRLVITGYVIMGGVEVKN